MFNKDDSEYLRGLNDIFAKFLCEDWHSNVETIAYLSSLFDGYLIWFLGIIILRGSLILNLCGSEVLIYSGYE